MLFNICVNNNQEDIDGGRKKERNKERKTDRVSYRGTPLLKNIKGLF